MASDITICSNALLKLGAPGISSFSDQTQAASLCANLWPTVRNAVLREHPWNCAVKRVTLSPDTATPSWGYAYQFTLPSDCLRVLEVQDNLDYRIESGKILTGESAVNLKYIYRNIDCGSYDDLLVDALIQRMAAELAYPVTKSSAQQQAESQKYTAIIQKARSVDASEEPTEDFADYPLITQRYF